MIINVSSLFCSALGAESTHIHKLKMTTTARGTGGLNLLNRRLIL